MNRVGSRAQVMHGNAKITGGGLKKKDLKYNKQCKIVSKKMSSIAKKEKRLQKAGYTTIKGQFGAVRMQRGGEKCSTEFCDRWSRRIGLSSRECTNSNNSPINCSEYRFRQFMKDVETGNLAEVQARLVGRKKIDVDTKDPLGDTALIIASKKGHINVVQALLDAGANIDQQDQRGYTALMISLYRFIRVPTEYSNIVTLLLDYNANIHIETMPRTVSISKVSPFSFALDGQEQLMKHYTAEKILRILQSNERQDIQSEIPILDVKKMRIYYRILTKYRQDRNAGYRYNST